MIVFPAIDLKAGQVVRLAEGDMARATVYGDDPAAQAMLFAEAGSQFLHVVDLDGSFAGRAENREAPCYSCLFPEADDVEETNCATMGVFAPLTGIIGTMQAAEALKFLIGLPTLSGRLLLLDARSMRWTSVALTRDPLCSVCGVGA